MSKAIDWLQGLPQRVDMIKILEGFVWFDWVVLTVLLLGLLYGVRKGMMRMIAEVLEVILVIFMTMQLFPKVVYYLTNNIERLTPNIATPIAYLVTLSLIWILVTIIDSYLKKLLKTELLWPIKIFGGAFLGLIGALLVLGIFTEGLQQFPSWSLKKVMEPGRSITGSKIAHIVPFINDTISNPASLKEYLS